MDLGDFFRMTTYNLVSYSRGQLVLDVLGMLEEGIG
jgi:hypothetical protein